MLFMIIWDTAPEKMMETIKAAKEGKFAPPAGIKTVTEYGTPSGLFWQIVEASDQEAVYKYVVPLLYLHRKVDVFPAITPEKFAALF